MPGFVGYYGIPSFFYGEPVPEQTENEEKFHRVARSIIKRLLEGSPSVILIKDLSHGGANLWTDKIPEIREIALSEGGKLLVVHDARCKQYLFIFDVLTDSFFEMIYHVLIWHLLHHYEQKAASRENPAKLVAYLVFFYSE